MNKLNENKAITLIALVITIVVLLILAGVTIAAISGNESIMRKGTEASQNTNQSQNQEQLQLEIAQLKLESAEVNNKSYLEFILDCEDCLQSKLNTKDLHIDKENKKILFNNYLYSIDEDCKLTKEDKGIILNTNTLYLQMMNDQKFNKTLEVIKHNVDGDITWETSNAEIATVSNGVVTPVSEGEAIITATCNADQNYLAKCKVVVEKFIDDSYVQYDVEYVDTYSGKTFTQNTGWRLITQEQNQDGTYNIKFISTGIPVRIYHMAAYGIVINQSWIPSASQVDEYCNKFYDTASRKNSAYDAAGLYYNFEKIIFKKQIINVNIANKEYMKGAYTKIIAKDKNNIMKEQNGDITGSVFNIKEGVNVRNVTLSDIRGYDKIESVQTSSVTSYDSGDEYADLKQGLFKLSDYNLDVSNVSKTYFLANPSDIKSFYHISAINYNGTRGNSNGGTIRGLRPVIEMQNVRMIKDGCVWKIEE